MNLQTLKQILSGRLVKKHFTRHFRRLAILEMLRGGQVGTVDVPPALTQSLSDAALQEPDALLAKLESHANGLDEFEAEAIRQRVGWNEVDHETPLPWWAHLWHCYSNPFSLLLTVLALISYFTEDMKAAIVISLMIVLSTVLRFVQETRSNQAAEQAQGDGQQHRDGIAAGHVRKCRRRGPALVWDHPALQSRPNRWKYPLRDLVPGDVVVLSAGDMIPADLRVLSAKDLFINQAAMTGESLPVEKFAQPTNPQAHSPLELDNIVFMGTNVVSGTATAVAVETGTRTYFGALAQRVVTTDRTPTAFQSGVNKISWVLIRFMFVMTPIVSADKRIHQGGLAGSRSCSRCRSRSD